MKLTCGISTVDIVKELFYWVLNQKISEFDEEIADVLKLRQFRFHKEHLKATSANRVL